MKSNEEILNEAFQRHNCVGVISTDGAIYKAILEAMHDVRVAGINSGVENSRMFGEVKEPEISEWRITTGMGKTRDSLPFLTEDQYDEFNTIGYSGKDNEGDPCGRQEYLNRLGIGKFKVTQTKYDDGSFEEAFTIVRVR